MLLKSEIIFNEDRLYEAELLDFDFDEDEQGEFLVLTFLCYDPECIVTATTDIELVCKNRTHKWLMAIRGYIPCSSPVPTHHYFDLCNYITTRVWLRIQTAKIDFTNYHIVKDILAA